MPAPDPRQTPGHARRIRTNRDALVRVHRGPLIQIFPVSIPTRRMSAQTSGSSG